jgi:transposase-like protein
LVEAGDGSRATRAPEPRAGGHGRPSGSGQGGRSLAGGAGAALHKWRNLEKCCPAHARRELKRDYDAIAYAKSGLAACEAYAAFVKKWTTLCPQAVKSLEEAGEKLLTFYAFPKAMWKSLRTTNSIENLSREFRRRTKTQALFSTEEAAVTLLYGLVAFGQIQMRRI